MKETITTVAVCIVIVIVAWRYLDKEKAVKAINAEHQRKKESNSLGFIDEIYPVGSYGNYITNNEYLYWVVGSTAYKVKVAPLGEQPNFVTATTSQSLVWANETIIAEHLLLNAKQKLKDAQDTADEGEQEDSRDDQYP